jgi:NAD(P)-dependent dehydrogenase (short-subunit alcohol dehydrogenase family)
MDLDPTNSLTFTGGVVTKRPRPGLAVLAAYGGAFEALIRGLALDLKPMRVNLVAPGAVRTPMFDKFPKEKLDEILEVYKNGTTTGRIGKPEDVAEAYIYLMKDPFVTGAVIETNGGSVLT